MVVYAYKAKKRPGEIKEGQIEAGSESEAVAKINSLNLFPVSVEEKTVTHKQARKVSARDTIDFTHQLSTLMNSGATLIESLEALKAQAENMRFKEIIADISMTVKEGADFSESLRKYPKLFSTLYISLVEIGEKSGSLGENLRRVAEFLEEDLDFKTNMVSILTYPLLILVVGVLTIFVLLTFVVPKLVTIFEELGQTLPLMTTILISVSEFFSKYGLGILAGAALAFLLFRQFLRNPRNRFGWEKFKVNLPVLGNLLNKIELSQFARTLSLLLRNGVSLGQALDLLSKNIPNLFFREQISQIRTDIHQGVSLNESMKKNPVFPPAFINVVAVGERSGVLDRVLENVFRDYNKDINRQIKHLMSLLEPFLIVGVGFIVFLIVISILLPIFSIDFNF